MSKILYKLSGEFINQAKVTQLAPKLNANKTCQVAIMVGGGNIIRGRDFAVSKRQSADQKGLQGTLANAEKLAKYLAKDKMANQIFTSFSLKSKYPVFSQKLAERSWQQHKIIILAGGTGYPYFSTDAAAVLRALQLGCEKMVKITKVNGVYSADPEKVKSAKKIKQISYQKYLGLDLRVIEPVAVALASCNDLPIYVTDYQSLIHDQKDGSWIK